MASRFDFKKAPERNGGGRVVAIFIVVTLITAAAIGAVVWFNRDTSSSSKTKQFAHAPPEGTPNANDPLHKVDGLTGDGAPPDTAVKPEKLPETDPKDAVPPVDKTEGEEKPPVTNREEPTENPEKGKVWVGDDPVTDRPVRPDGLAGGDLRSFDEKFAAAGDDLAVLRELLNQTTENSPEYIKVGKAISRVSGRMLTGAIPSDKLKTYQVKAGDNLIKIARELNVPWQSLMLSSKLESANHIRVGQKLHAYQGNFSVKISKNAWLLKLYDDGKLFKLYEIGIGRQGMTPEGKFTVGDKLVNPAWYPPGGKTVASGSPDNPLGTRFMGLIDGEGRKTSYAIHGSKHDIGVGRSISHGCIRMRNHDAEELYALLPSKAEVVIEK